MHKLNLSIKWVSWNKLKSEFNSKNKFKSERLSFSFIHPSTNILMITTIRPMNSSMRTMARQHRFGPNYNNLDFYFLYYLFKLIVVSFYSLGYLVHIHFVFLCLVNDLVLLLVDLFYFRLDSLDPIDHIIQRIVHFLIFLGKGLSCILLLNIRICQLVFTAFVHLVDLEVLLLNVREHYQIN